MLISAVLKIPMIVKQEDVLILIFNTTIIHSEAAINYSIGKNNIQFILSSALNTWLWIK